MAKGKLIVFNEPKSADVEGAYNAWYDGAHLPEILAHVPAITGARRFRIASGQDLPLPGAPRYMALYDIEADNVMDALVQLGQATQDGRINMTDTIRTEPASTFLIYEEIKAAQRNAFV